MLSNKLSQQEISEIKAFIRKQRKKMKEGSESSAAGAFATPAAFAKNKNSDGTEVLNLKDKQYSYTEKVPKTNINFIKIHEASYKEFKQDPNATEVQKVNRKILEINKMLREISRSLDHSIKLKQESSMDNSTYWKRTNEAILKINRRLSEIGKKARKLANIKELAATSVKDKLISAFNKAGLKVTPSDVAYHQVGKDEYEFDVMLEGEPYAIDFNQGELIYQDFDKETRLGNINQEPELIKMIAQTFIGFNENHPNYDYK
jgi:hypothetical protein